MKTKPKKPTIAGLALQTGIDRKTIRRRLVESGLYPPDNHLYSDCLKAIRPTGKSTTLEDAKARLLDAKVRQIEREEKLRGGDVLPVAWFAECVGETFRDRFSFANFKQLHEETVNALLAYGAVYGERPPQDAGGLQRLEIHPLHEQSIRNLIDQTFESLRNNVDDVRDKLIRHLKTGTMESGGKTSLAEIDDHLTAIFEKLSADAREEFLAAIKSK
jgi:hypothetical protein